MGPLALTADGKTRIANTSPLSLVDAETGAIRRLLDDDHQQRGRAWFTSDDRAVVCQGPNYLELWDAQTGEELASYDLTTRFAAAGAVKARTPKQPRLTPPPARFPRA